MRESQHSLPSETFYFNTKCRYLEVVNNINNVVAPEVCQCYVRGGATRARVQGAASGGGGEGAAPMLLN